MHKKIIYVAISLGIIGIIAWKALINRRQPINAVDKSSSTSATQQPERNKSFDKTQHPTNEPGSLWWVVNKNRKLPEGYMPSDLVVPNVKLRLDPSAEQMQIRKVVISSLEKMFKKAEVDGVQLVFGSGFRSYELQKQFYDSYVAKDGQVAADRYSARPGTSEHQTGLTFDVTSVGGSCDLEICFGDTPEGQWIAKHAHEFGFIIRYPDGKESITTYQFEPWHLRYVGEPLAQELARTGKTMEEFFGLN